VNLSSSSKIPAQQFQKRKYIGTIQKYFAGTTKHDSNVLNAVESFVDFLLDNDCSELNNLLLCDPDNLLSMNDNLENKYGVGSGMELKIMKIVFNYSGDDTIKGIVKQFFYKENLALCCPYCNIGDTTFVPDDNHGSAAIHELDHYFEKAGHPFLCYSFFNLIPADGNCNGSINKGGTKFNDVYYINPYKEGFGRAFKFKPVTNGTTIQSFQLIVEGSPGDRFFDGMLGVTGKIDPNSKSGNINVFKLNAKYNNDKELLKSAAKIAGKISKRAAGRRSLLAFLKRLGKDIAQDAHITWYEYEIDRPFKDEDFNQKPHSKLYRDIHDHIFDNEGHRFNEDIKKIIARRFI
jgi:hypothetical protein